MPCGGIYPAHPHNIGKWPTGETPWCMHCNGTDPPPDHEVEEWDGQLHGKCIEEFLQTDEGRLVLAHGHVVARLEADGSVTVLHEGRYT